MYFHINISLPQARIKSKYQMENFFHGVIINLEKAMAPHSSTLAWKILWTEEPGRLHTMGSLRIRHNWATSLYFSLSCIGEGNGNPLQCSCLENPRDREPGGLPSMGWHRVGHDWSNLAASLICILVISYIFTSRNGVFPAVSVNRGCHSHQPLQSPLRCISKE